MSICNVLNLSICHYTAQCLENIGTCHWDHVRTFACTRTLVFIQLYELVTALLFPPTPSSALLRTHESSRSAYSKRLLSRVQCSIHMGEHVHSATTVLPHRRPPLNVNLSFWGAAEKFAHLVTKRGAINTTLQYIYLQTLYRYCTRILFPVIPFFKKRRVINTRNNPFYISLFFIYTVSK